MSIEKNINTEKETLSEDVRTQLENLGLTVKEFEGRILDVGAGERKLAKELKNLTAADIISVDDYTNEETSEYVVTADARNLPFEDNSFDTVISHCAIPHIFAQLYSHDHPELSEKEMKNSMVKALKEIIRVIKPGSKAIMAPVGISSNSEFEKAVSRSLKKSINEIQDDSIVVSFDFMKEIVDSVHNEKSKHYRLTILKK